MGLDNRTCGLRIPQGGPQARRVENRLPGVDANPYLAMATTLACGLLGMQQEYRQRHRLIAVPMVGPMPLPAPSWRRWKGWPNQALATLLGPQFVSTYCQLKLSEWQEFNRQVTAWEYRHLLGQA
jgi:glutamine synthetase